jgi:hypothetical protein
MVAVLILFIGLVLAALFLLVLAGLTALLTLSLLAGLTALLALSELVTLLSLFLHIVCHKSNSPKSAERAAAFLRFKRHLEI